MSRIPAEAFSRKSFDRDAADEAAIKRATQPWRVARPEFSPADHRIQIGAGWWDVQRNFLTGQSEMQVIHQMIAQMIPAKAIGKGVTFHPPQAHRIADGVLKVAQRFLELFKDACWPG